MGSSQQLVAGLALLAIVASVSARPEPAELNPLPPADLPKAPVNLTEPATPTEKPAKLPEKPAKLPEKPVNLTEDGAKVSQEAPKGEKLAEDAFLASLPQALPGKEVVQVPVVIADLPEPEAVVVVPNGPRGRLFTRMARAYIPAEARGAEGDGYAVGGFAFPYSVNDPATAAAHIMSRTLPRQQEDQSSLEPSSLEPSWLGAAGAEDAAKKTRRHRVLFRDEPVIDARSAHGSAHGSADDDSRKFVQPTPGIQHSPASHSYEVREPGRETIVMMRPMAQDHPADPEEKNKLQLIRHIHHQQFSVPFASQANQQLVSVPYASQAQQKANPSGISIYPPVFNSPPEGQKEVTGYFPFVVSDPGLVYNGGLAQTVTDIFEYGHAPAAAPLAAAPLAAAPACTEKRTGRKARAIRRARAVGTLPEDLEVGTTAEPAAETTLAPLGPEQRDVGKLAGPVVQSITRDDDDDKMQTTIVLGGEVNEDPDPDEEDDDEDDDEEQAPDALDEDDAEEEESPPIPASTPDKGDFQKKLKDKLEKIEKKVRKRVKNSQAGIHGIRKQVNRHVTEILMHSEGGSGLEEAGPIVSKLVVRRGGVAIAGPGGIATAGFGGTAIVGPGGTAYTSPDSLAVAGPGARVISVPSSKLQEMFDSFRKENGRNIDAFKPSWLGTIPPDGKLVATGPVVFFNPPEQVLPGFTLS